MTPPQRPARRRALALPLALGVAGCGRGAAAPSDGEVRKYYAQHPELFAQRRIYSLEEIALVPQPGIADALRERAARGASIEQLAEWLEERAVRHAVSRGTRAAEHIPLDVLPKLQAMQDGEAQVIEAGADRLVVLRVAASRAAPLDEASAAPLIQRYLAAARSNR